MDCEVASNFISCTFNKDVSCMREQDDCFIVSFSHETNNGVRVEYKINKVDLKLLGLNISKKRINNGCS